MRDTPQRPEGTHHTHRTTTPNMHTLNHSHHSITPITPLMRDIPQGPQGPITPIRQRGRAPSQWDAHQHQHQHQHQYQHAGTGPHHSHAPASSTVAHLTLSAHAQQMLPLRSLKHPEQMLVGALMRAHCAHQDASASAYTDTHGTKL